MRYVSVGRRFLATIIDGVIIWLATLPFADTQASTTNGANFQYELRGGSLLLGTLIWIGYYTVLEGWVGATAGKFLLGIRVVAEDGSKAGFMAAFIRTISRYVDAIPFIIPYLLGAIMIWSSPKRQRLGDRWANTVVVRWGSNQGDGVMPGGEMSTGLGATGGPAPMPPPPPAPPSEG